MRNSGVPEAKINEYITNRLQYFATVPPAPAPALNAAASSSTAPAPALSVVDDGDANSNIDGTPINDSAFVKTGADTAQAVMQNIQAALATGANAKPQNTAVAGASTPPTQTPKTVSMPLPKSKPQRPQRGTPDELTIPQMNNTPPPALSSNPPPSSAGILSNPVGAVASALNQQGRRNSTQLAVERPDLGIDTNEMLMRVGGRGLANAAQGGLAAYGAMFDEYGNVQDQRRNNALAEYQEDYKAQKDEQDRLNALEAARIKAEAKKKPVKAPEQSPYMEATLNAIEAIEAAVEEGGNDWLNPFDNVTGLIGAGMALIPGTPAYDTNAQIETVVSSIGFDRLQKMRDDSPTGGALGQVSERELSQLNASLGNLRQSQSREAFKRNLALVKKHYLSAVEAIRQQQIEYARMNGLSVPASAASASQSGSAIPSVGQSTSIGGVTVTRIK